MNRSLSKARRPRAEKTGDGDLPRLYAAAVAFRDLAPWRWMEDDLLIGVEEPASGTVGYWCVLGALESVFGLAVYVGAEGFYRHHRLATGEHDPDDFEEGITQECLLASFEGRGDLTERDRREVAGLGLTFRGRNAWPLFRSSRPGCAPWYVEGSEVALLSVALEQASDVCVRLRDGAPLFPPNLDRPVLVRRWDPARGLWHDSWQAPPSEPQPAPVPPPATTRIERVLRATRRAALAMEVALVHLPTIVSEGGNQRPFFPRVWFQADKETGVVGLSDLMEPGRTPADLQENFLAAVERYGVLPAEIRTASEESFALLAPIADALGIRLRRVRSTPALKQARDAMEEAFR
jgi:hypothetical protein